MITQEELKLSLDYNPDTGVFTWKIKPQSRIPKGSVAGTLHHRGYIHIILKGKAYLAHRLAFLFIDGKFPEFEIDHENHIKHDNRWVNLIEKTHRENGKNQSKSIRNTSGTTGVHWSAICNKWRANITSEGVRHNLGLFSRKEDAIEVRKLAEIKYGFHENHGN